MYTSKGREVNVLHSFKLHKSDFVVIDDYDGLTVWRLENLHSKKEDTQAYKSKEKSLKEIEEKINKLKGEEDELSAKLQNQAIESLIIRMKINTLFGKDDELTQIAMGLAKELRKLIVEDKETLK